jgi:hypothetical protein
MTDWYFADTAKKRGFTARPVVGGVFAQLLYDRALWSKWAGRDRTQAAGWAPLPAPRQAKVLLAPATTGTTAWRYRETAPAGEWAAPGFSDADWASGPGGFGAMTDPGAKGGPPAPLVRTAWSSQEIWLRSTFDGAHLKPETLRLRVTHSGRCEIYLNGVLAAQRPNGERGYDDHEIAPAARAALRPGINVLAVKAGAGGNRKRALIDVGLIAVEP